MTVIRISGASLGDLVFTTDKTIFGVEISWNVTRMQNDADAGSFGPPIVIPMELLPPMSDLHKANVDYSKIAGMVADHQLTPKTSQLHKPALQVMVVIGDTTYRMPVDGNHRICARRLIGYPDFRAHVVPVELESAYRVTHEILSG